MSVVESASGAVVVTIALVFAITMSEVALADDTSTSVRDKAFIKGANATVAVGSVFTVVSADAAVADLVDSPFGDAVITVDGADEAVFVTIALVFAITMGAGADADGTFAFIVTPAPTFAIAILAVAGVPTIARAVANAPTIALAEITRLIPTIIRIHFS